ncbi:hypothetical protein ALC56_14441, partial [Trachymyrmex septentrionalis]
RRKHSNMLRCYAFASIRAVVCGFKHDGINLKRVYNDHVNTDMFYEDFCDLCHKC